MSEHKPDPLAAIVEAPPADQSTPAQAEESFFEKAGTSNDELRQVTIQARKNHEELRLKYAPKALELVYTWTIILTITLMLCGIFNVLFKGILGIKDFQFLSDKVIIALISGTSVNVIAVFLVVIRNLFPSK